MKTINEIINDLIEFAAENDVLGDGEINIKIGDLKIKKTIPVIKDDFEDEDVPTVEDIMNNSTPEELEEAKKKAKQRFSSEEFDKMFEKYNTDLMDPNK